MGDGSKEKKLGELEIDDSYNMNLDEEDDEFDDFWGDEEPGESERGEGHERGEGSERGEGPEEFEEYEGVYGQGMNSTGVEALEALGDLGSEYGVDDGLRVLKGIFNNASTVWGLSEAVGVIKRFKEYTGMSYEKVKHLLIDLAIVDRMGIKDLDILLGYSDSDTSYKELLGVLIPESSRGGNSYSHKRGILVGVLGKAILIMLWLEIESRFGDKDYRCFTENVRHFAFYCKNDDCKMSVFVDGATREYEEVGIAKAIEGAYIILTRLDILGWDISKEDIEEDTLNGEEDYVSKVDSMEVRAIVNDIMNIYDNLYGPCFVQRPVGVLTSDGILTLSKNGVDLELLSEGSNYAKKFYEGISSLTGGYLHKVTPRKNMDSSFISNEGKLVDSYCPLYHVRNIYGLTKDNKKINSWGKFRDILYNDLYEKVTNTLEKIDHDTITIQNTIKDLFTNCIIIDQFDRVKILRMRARIAGLSKDIGEFIGNNAKEMFSSDTGKLVNSSVDQVGIQNILFIFDEKAYNAEILFAYKAYEKLIASGLQPSANDVILGRDLNGDDVLENLNDAGNVVIGIIAGSRSGKGVLTLNILASLYADDCPVMYLDYKPDMAATLWDLEKDMKTAGANCKIFSVDAMADRRNDGVTPVRAYPYGLNALEGTNLSREDFSLVPYLKSMQFACLLAILRSSGDLDSRKKVFFVLDEAQKVNSRFGIMLEKLNRGISENNPKKNEEGSELYNYYFNLREVFNTDLKDGMRNIINTVGGMGRVSLIVLGQKADPDEWKLQGEGSWRNGLFGNIIGNCNIKLIGRDSGNSPSYGTPNLKKALQGGEFLDERGYFVRYRGAKTPERGVGCTLFKSYLVLNKNDFDLRAYENNALNPVTFTGALITNISDTVVRANVIHNDFINIDRTIRESVGFGGLMKLIMGREDNAVLAKKLSYGYEYMNTLFSMLGFNKKYSCVEEYLYDCSPDSLFTLSDLQGIIRGGGSEPVKWFSKGKVDVSDAGGGSESVKWFSKGKVDVSDAGDVGAYKGVKYFANKGKKNSCILKVNVRKRLDYGEESGEHGAHGVHGGHGVYGVKSDDFVGGNSRDNFVGEYSRGVSVGYNPFKSFGVERNPLMALNALKMTSGILLGEIRKVFMDLNRIEYVCVSNSGLMVINNIAFKPKFSDSIIESLPFDIKDQVANGHVAELFNFGDLYRFKNLQYLEVDNERIAEGRMRREMVIRPKISWGVLFKKFRQLRSLIIAGNVITDEEAAKEYNDSGRAGFILTEKLREKFKIGAGILSSSRMDKVWDSPSFKVFKGALGFTLGIKGIMLASAIFGPWGILFGAFTAAGTYREMRKRNFFK